MIEYLRMIFFHDIVIKVLIFINLNIKYYIFVVSDLNSKHKVLKFGYTQKLIIFLLNKQTKKSARTWHPISKPILSRFHKLSGA